MLATMNKYDYEAKINREKRENERRKNILILILRYLINMGYSESAFKLQEDTNLDLDKYDVADNMDLYIILSDYEEYFELRFNKKPKIVTKLIDNDLNTNRLPNIKKKESKNYSNVDKFQKNLSDKPKTSNKKIETSITSKNEEPELKLELVGQSVIPIKTKDKEKETFSFNDQKESILLKPIPDNFFGNNEMRELGSLVRRYITISLL